MGDETKKPDHLKLVPEDELDEEEKEFRALRRDVPGVKGAADAGMLTISVGKQPTPKNTFYRTHKTFRPVVPIVNVEVGMDIVVGSRNIGIGPRIGCTIRSPAA